MGRRPNIWKMLEQRDPKLFALWQLRAMMHRAGYRPSSYKEDMQLVRKYVRLRVDELKNVTTKT